MAASRPLHYMPGPSRRHSASPVLGTLICAVMGGAAIGLWMMTFEPHGRLDLSAYLFPIATFAVNRLYLTQSVPASIWYASMFGQWLLIGVMIDAVRWLLAKRYNQRKSAESSP